MQRLTVERNQVWIYLAAIAAGLLAGTVRPALSAAFAALLWPTLATLLYATFVQIRLLHLREAFGDHRFTSAVLVGNFVTTPVLVFGLVQLLPADQPLRLGVMLVLLVPCTDWFITFAQLSGGDVPQALAVTPANLLLQLVLLPLHLWWMSRAVVAPMPGLSEMLPALLILLLPLGLAALTERWIEARERRLALRERLAWWPVPLLALVVFLIAGIQAPTVHDALALLPIVVPIFVAYLLLAALAAKLLAAAWRLPVTQGRTLAFTLSTRNSFVVLPLALALPEGWAVTAVVIVIQSLVELCGMIAFLHWIPRQLFHDRHEH